MHRFADFSLRAVPRGVQDHRGLFFRMVGLGASVSTLFSTHFSSPSCFWAFFVGLVSLVWLLHSANVPAIRMVLVVGVLRARSFLRHCRRTPPFSILVFFFPAWSTTAFSLLLS